MTTDSSQQEFAERTVAKYIRQFNEISGPCDTALKHLKADFDASRFQDVEDWAEDVFHTLLQKETSSNKDARAKALALDQSSKVCAAVLDQMVNDWERQRFVAEYEQAIDEWNDLMRKFKADNTKGKKYENRPLIQILMLCLPIERARALLYTNLGSNAGSPRSSSRGQGIPWCSKLHKVKDTYFSEIYPEEFAKWQQLVAAYQKAHGMGGTGATSISLSFTPPMSGNLFYLLFSEKLNLQRYQVIRKLSMPAMPSSFLMEEDYGVQVQVVRKLVEKYKQAEYQEALFHVDVDFLRCCSAPNVDLTIWSKAIYVTLRDSPSDVRCLALNRYKSTCLGLVKELALEWEERNFSPDFEAIIKKVFRSNRLIRILHLCLPLERAEALYKEDSGNGTASGGMPWFSELHVTEATERNIPPDQVAWMKTFMETKKFKPPMEEGLFRLLFSEQLQLQQSPRVAPWSTPALSSDDDWWSMGGAGATGGGGQGPVMMGRMDSNAAAAAATATGAMQKMLPKEIREAIEQFENRYNEQLFQEAMDTLEADFSKSPLQDRDEWAKQIYVVLRDNPSDSRTKGLNNDRRTCLKLVYELVDEWKTHDYSDDFGRGIQEVFKVRRLVRILSFGLPMDRAQALYKMTHDGKVGLPWCSKLHMEDDTPFSRNFPHEFRQWKERLQEAGYTGFPPMNHRLFRLLFNERLGLQHNNADFLRWSLPQMPPDVPPPPIATAATTTNKPSSSRSTDLARERSASSKGKLFGRRN